MIVSASRRTDIPAYYSRWFLNRIREGYVLVPNPYNPKFISRINLSPSVIDCIVFWTKNPAPMLDRLSALDGYHYYFQYTLNPYGADAENNLPPLSRRIDTFRRLADRIGREKVIWRYDPLFTNETYTVAYHEATFARIAEALKEHTERCMLGFIDHYYHIRRAVSKLAIEPLRREEIELSARSFKRTADQYGIRLDTCTAKVDLRSLGIPAGMCIDKELVERIAGYPIDARKDKNQRDVCNCVDSIDIGTYESCLNGCIYCYAIKGNYDTVLSNRHKHDPESPLLIGNVSDLPEGTVIRDREMRSLRTDQLSLL